MKKVLAVKLLFLLALCGGLAAVPLAEITISNDDFGELLRCQWHVWGWYCTGWSQEYPSQCARDCDLGYATCLNQPVYLPAPKTAAEIRAECLPNHGACMEFCGTFDI